MTSLKSTAAIAALSLTSLALGAGPAAAYKVFVSNEKENTITVIDSEKLEVVHTIKTGNRPRGIILSNDGKWSSYARPTTTACRFMMRKRSPT